MELTHTKAPPQIWESYKPFKNRLTMPGLFVRTGTCRCHVMFKIPITMLLGNTDTADRT